jgi:predicted FMN-binding regulatory protein PaiB
MTDFASKYPPRGDDDVLRLLHEQPVAWIMSQTTAGPLASVLPLRPVVQDGRLVALKGHFARANPQVAALRSDSKACVLVLGTNGYTSPSWLTDRTQAPSWDYASVWFETEVRLMNDPGETIALMRDIIGVMEEGRPNAWSLEEMGSRYEKLARGIVGFEARILSAHPRFRLGQDERDDVYPELRKGLARENPDLLAWMDYFNPDRNGK